MIEGYSSPEEKNNPYSPEEFDKIFGKMAVESAGRIINDTYVENAEKLPMKFAQYKELCNKNNDGSRLRGIITHELYEAVISDPKTIYLQYDGLSVPFLISINQGASMGYEPEKCIRYAKDSKASSDIRILAVPIHELSDEAKKRAAEIFASNPNIAIYFSSHDRDTDKTIAPKVNEADALSEILRMAGLEHENKPLITARTQKGDEQAAMYLYSCRVEQVPDGSERKTLKLKDVYDNYEKNVGPETRLTIIGEVTTRLEMGDNISDVWADKLWKLYDKVFENFGEGHPISMQDSKEDFMEVLRSEHTMISVTYRKGETEELDEPLCFADFNDDISTLYWLNQKYLKDEINNSAKNCKSKNLTGLFTPGLVSTPLVAAALSPKTLGLFVKSAVGAGMSAELICENTNLSKRYVPVIMDRVIRENHADTDVSKTESIDGCSYYLWNVFKPKDV